MFFIGIFGVQNKERSIREYDNIICPECSRLSRAELFETYTYFHLFFIPLFKWNKKYYVKLRCCNIVYIVDDDYISELKKSHDIDFRRLKKIQESEHNYCNNCGNIVDPRFSYCPFCGQKLS